MERLNRHTFCHTSLFLFLAPGPSIAVPLGARPVFQRAVDPKEGCIKSMLSIPANGLVNSPLGYTTAPLLALPANFPHTPIWVVHEVNAVQRRVLERKIAPAVGPARLLARQRR